MLIVFFDRHVVELLEQEGLVLLLQDEAGGFYLLFQAEGELGGFAVGGEWFHEVLGVGGVRAALFDAVDLVLVAIIVVVQLVGGTHAGFSALILAEVLLLVSGRRSLRRLLAVGIGEA